MAVGDTAVTEAEDHRFWERLLTRVKEKRVVPVIGPDLLPIEIDGRRTLLDTLLAERLADRLEIDIPASLSPLTLHKVACRYQGAPADIHETLQGILTALLAPRGPIRPPEPLRQLASIRPLKLFITTTFDPLLARALEAVRGTEAKTFAFSGYERKDLDVSLDLLPGPVVFHLFGRASSMRLYSVTEEETLEVFHALQSDERPKRLLKELANRQILLIGNRFPDWLTRFFLRIAHGQPLWEARDRADVVADEHTRVSSDFLAFVQRLGSRNRVYQRSAVEFVSELAQRWETWPGREESSPIPHWLEMKPGAVFLSYASEDRESVEALAGALTAANISVWFDRAELHGGDDFAQKIQNNIDCCSLFIPLLSRNVLQEDPRFFRREWGWALDAAQERPFSQSFIVPLALDDVPRSHVDLPERFRNVHWLTMQGAPGPELVSELKGLLRAHKRATSVLR